MNDNEFEEEMKRLKNIRDENRKKLKFTMNRIDKKLTELEKENKKSKENKRKYIYS